MKAKQSQDKPQPSGEAPKQHDLARATSPAGEHLTDNLGHAISDDQNSLKGGVRGPSLLEDFLLREKISHFDHERIPERVVHARGAGAHGVFKVYDDSLSEVTAARVLTDPSRETPVFVRFSTVAGSRGSADTARDVRGFAVKFYTQEGNWDLVGNNIPPFFIQDAIKFPDLIHSVKPEPHREIPQAASAHDTFYDFVSLTPETLHMLMWVMSDRAIPRSFANMEGFGVHTFRLVNAEGRSHFVKFHWKPLSGIHSLVWDEALELAGRDPDVHRRALWDDIERGDFPEWELGVQVFTEEQAAEFDFDVLDATKLVPEALVPVRRVGKMTLNRNPDNYFAETEQVAFMPTNLVPGLDFSDDPLLQGRLFSYLDTQLSRLGSPNWPELPINRPLARVSNHQRDGHMRYTINPGRVAYEPNSLGGGRPAEVSPQRGGFVSYPEPLSGVKIRQRAESFADHYGQAKLFWNSMSPVEKMHIVRAQQFELGKVETRDIRLKMIEHLRGINPVLGDQVAAGLGEMKLNGPLPTDAELMKLLEGAVSETTAAGGVQKDEALSMVDHNTAPPSVRGRKVALLAADGVSAEDVGRMRTALEAQGALAEVVGTHLGSLQGQGGEVMVDKTLLTTPSVIYDAVYLPGGSASLKALGQLGDALRFVAQAYKHGKAVGSSPDGLALLKQAGVAVSAEQGVLDLSKQSADDFVEALAQHRFWNRSGDLVPA
ncbi:catalase HPII [Deinococcus irradiatisoli]|uniref:Catalase n=1 Tax=Deinococcus irradiatisoli TaxID=2202254 RepID=A0A2Z3JF49_9DEIO|nr:catalase [Deinococcus irradiatisoli]AWN22616.1 catalase HPII [Deinococcus irradiatisoli]